MLGIAGDVRLSSVATDVVTRTLEIGKREIANTDAVSGIAGDDVSSNINSEPRFRPSLQTYSIGSISGDRVVPASQSGMVSETNSIPAVALNGSANGKQKASVLKTDACKPVTLNRVTERERFPSSRTSRPRPLQWF